MTWDVLTIIGTLAFAISGAIVAIEEEYDIFGIFILGLITAFGGGMIRNILIGLPIETLWKQDHLFIISIISICLVLLFPSLILKGWQKWGNFFDAIGLAAFSIQGALYAVNKNLPLSAAIVAAVLTGSGGGLLRDILAGRKPLILREEIYALWAILSGLIIGLKISTDPIFYYFLLISVVTLRMLSLHYHWKLPSRSFIK